jgi:hypothetical protein
MSVGGPASPDQSFTMIQSTRMNNLLDVNFYMLIPMLARLVEVLKPPTGWEAPFLN